MEKNSVVVLKNDAVNSFVLTQIGIRDGSIKPRLNRFSLIAIPCLFERFGTDFLPESAGGIGQRG